ncbi:MAG: hypothetical protein MASP_01870 [Candidatus Methanolliviera sp. GoM_asphalt]|nr:MAG: hypothetical protein MASP_01870 [Candidatus Methanolliviera sp. GoM_asphalt]
MCFVLYTEMKSYIASRERSIITGIIPSDMPKIVLTVVARMIPTASTIYHLGYLRRAKIKRAEGIMENAVEGIMEEIFGISGAKALKPRTRVEKTAKTIIIRIRIFTLYFAKSSIKSVNAIIMTIK